MYLVFRTIGTVSQISGIDFKPTSMLTDAVICFIVLCHANDFNKTPPFRMKGPTRDHCASKTSHTPIESLGSKFVSVDRFGTIFFIEIDE